MGTEKIVVFDLEGILVDGEFLPEYAKAYGKEKEVLDITLKGIRGEIKWEDGLIKRVEMLVKAGATYEDAVRISNSLPLMKGAKDVCKELKSRGFKLITVSGGFKELLDRVKFELGIDWGISNELIFNNNHLIGIKQPLNVSSDKTVALKNILPAKKENIAVVVDGANDLTLLNMAGLKIAFNAQPIVEEKADVIIKEKDLSLILPHVLAYFKNKL